MHHPGCVYLSFLFPQSFFVVPVVIAAAFSSFFHSKFYVKYSNVNQHLLNKRNIIATTIKQPKKNLLAKCNERKVESAKNKGNNINHQQQ